MTNDNKMMQTTLMTMQMRMIKHNSVREDDDDDNDATSADGDDTSEGDD